MPDFAQLAKNVRRRGKARRFASAKGDDRTARQRIGADDARAYRKRKVKANNMTAEMKRRMNREQSAKAEMLNKRIKGMQKDKPF